VREKVPLSQAMHTVLDVAPYRLEYVPARHATQIEEVFPPEALENVPMLHAIQSL
jgi:hypothetical protein